MAVKKNGKKDRHKSGFMIRLPEAFREPVAELKRKTRRPITVEVQMAMEAHLKANGVKAPEQ